MLGRIFPRQFDNASYHGHRFGVWLFIPILVVELGIGANSIINARFVATSADGIPLDSYDAAGAEAVISLFALLGLSRVLLGLTGVMALIRYRAMIHEVFAPGMHNRAYYHRYTEDNVDLCDVLSSFNFGAKVKLDELSRIMGLPGKPDAIDGSQVETYFNAGRIQEIADYCKSDVINTYRLWLRHELFRGRLDQNQFEYSERDVTRVVGSAADRAAG